MQRFRWLHLFRLWLGIEPNTTNHGEKWISALGAFLGIFVVYWVTWYAYQQNPLLHSSSLLLVASMGASAVLLFAVPQGVLSQPWPLVGGQLISAFIGVCCFKFFGASAWSAALAVGGAVGVMHYLRCLHPPGGATALSAVIGGAEVHQLGFGYLVTPVAINVAAILFVAVLFNALFSWRRYPAQWVRHIREAKALHTREQEPEFELTQEDFSAAMSKLNLTLDITTESLSDLFELAKEHSEKVSPHPEQIVPGRFYSNGKLGKLWSVRQVLDESDEDLAPSKDKIIFKTLAGAGAYDTGMCLRSEFRLWARFEVRRQANGHWERVVD